MENIQMILWSLPLTIVTFLVIRKLATKVKSPLFNPLLVSVLIIIPILLLTGASYQSYFSGSKVLNDLLQPAVVALALPLYEQLPQIRKRWKSILFICFIGSVCAVITGGFIALWLGASVDMAASVLPKSVTTPIAMAIAQTIDGIPAISAACVLFVGILGAVCGHFILDLCKIKNSAARGLSIGCCSHALGTARCAEISYKEGAYSSLALVICGIITSLLAPLLFPLILLIYQG